MSGEAPEYQPANSCEPEQANDDLFGATKPYEPTNRCELVKQEDETKLADEIEMARLDEELRFAESMQICDSLFDGYGSFAAEELSSEEQGAIVRKLKDAVRKSTEAQLTQWDDPESVEGFESDVSAYVDTFRLFLNTAALVRVGRFSERNEDVSLQADDFFRDTSIFPGSALNSGSIAIHHVVSPLGSSDRPYVRAYPRVLATGEPQTFTPEEMQATVERLVSNFDVPGIPGQIAHSNSRKDIVNLVMKAARNQITDSGSAISAEQWERLMGTLAYKLKEAERSSEEGDSIFVYDDILSFKEAKQAIRITFAEVFSEVDA